MDRNRLSSIDLNQVNTPCYLVDEALLVNNLKIMQEVQEAAGCKILLALKAFSMYSLFPVIREYLAGISASSPFEAQLGREEFGREVHTYSPAYKEEDFDQLVEWSDTLIFNSLNQWERFQHRIPEGVECGLRINPEYSEIDVDLYNPCARGSRLGIRRSVFPSEVPQGITGLHFHSLCEQNSDTLERTLEQIEEKFGNQLRQVSWVNFGGGHHITRPDYDLQRLIELIRRIKERYEVDVIMEPGEAVALNTGVLIASVVDIMENEKTIALLDTSAEAHMPDVIAMPYRPEVLDAAEPGKQAYDYLLTGNTCLAGDVIGEYSFAEKLVPGSRLVFLDMAHYTMVKNHMFNGIRLPDIAIRTSDDQYQTVRRFRYEDFRARL